MRKMILIIITMCIILFVTSLSGCVGNTATTNDNSHLPYMPLRERDSPPTINPETGLPIEGEPIR